MPPSRASIQLRPLPVKILCLYVRHGTAAYPESLAVLDHWYQRHGLIDQRTLWIVDNALPPDMAPGVLENGAVLRPGDNRAWEFSAWARAVSEASAEGVEYDFVHFVTSAFNSIYTGYLDHFFTAMLDYVRERQVWIRTCFFFLPWSCIRNISPWAAYLDPALVFAGPNSRQYRADAPLDAVYQARIIAWLEGQESGGHNWHSPIGQGPLENARFQSKTLAILNEHSLAITLRRAGIQLVDYCWLHAFQASPVAIIPDPPAETIQEKIRRKILGFEDPSAPSEHLHAS